MDIHVFPNKVRSSIKDYLLFFRENIECRPEFEDFILSLNPSLQYQFIGNYYYKTIV